MALGRYIYIAANIVALFFPSPFSQLSSRERLGKGDGGEQGVQAVLDGGYYGMVGEAGHKGIPLASHVKQEMELSKQDGDLEDREFYDHYVKEAELRPLGSHSLKDSADPQKSRLFLTTQQPDVSQPRPSEQAHSVGKPHPLIQARDETQPGLLEQPRPAMSAYTLRHSNGQIQPRPLMQPRLIENTHLLRTRPQYLSQQYPLQQLQSSAQPFPFIISEPSKQPHPFLQPVVSRPHQLVLQHRVELSSNLEHSSLPELQQKSSSQPHPLNQPQLLNQPHPVQLSHVTQPHPPSKTPVHYGNQQFQVAQQSSLLSPALPVTAPPLAPPPAPPPAPPTDSVVASDSSVQPPTLSGPPDSYAGGGRGGGEGGGGGHSLEQLHVLNTAKSRQIADLKRQLVAQKVESERHVTVLREEKVSVVCMTQTHPHTH